ESRQHGHQRDTSLTRNPLELFLKSGPESSPARRVGVGGVEEPDPGRKDIVGRDSVFESGQLHHALNHEPGAYQQSAGERQFGNDQTAAELTDPKRGGSSALILEHVVEVG